MLWKSRFFIIQIAVISSIKIFYCPIYEEFHKNNDKNFVICKIYEYIKKHKYHQLTMNISWKFKFVAIFWSNFLVSSNMGCKNSFFLSYSTIFKGENFNFCYVFFFRLSKIFCGILHTKDIFLRLSDIFCAIFHIC